MNLGGLFQAFKAAMALRDAARQFKASASTSEVAPAQTQSAAPSIAGQVEARLTGVVVAALKEAFDRDHARLELERARLEEEQRRSEAALRLELRRQAVDRELVRLRWLGGTAMIGWIASVGMAAGGIAGSSMAARIVLGAGWLLLLAALGAAFTVQGRVGRFTSSDDAAMPDPVNPIPLWLLISGLAATAVSLLL
jgi:hypothetical protein